MKGIFRNLHRYVLWLVVSFFFWAWIFTLITNAPPGTKVVLYAGLPAMERDALSTALEADKPENIRYVETWMFSDEMFNPANIATGDLFIVATGQVNQYLGTFQPLGEGDFPDLAEKVQSMASAFTMRLRAFGSEAGILPICLGRRTIFSSTPTPSIWGSGTALPTMPPCE